MWNERSTDCELVEFYSRLLKFTTLDLYSYLKPSVEKVINTRFRIKLNPDMFPKKKQNWYHWRGLNPDRVFHSHPHCPLRQSATPGRGLMLPSSRWTLSTPWVVCNGPAVAEGYTCADGFDREIKLTSPILILSKFRFGHPLDIGLKWCLVKKTEHF